MPIINVNAGERSYPVILGDGVLQRLRRPMRGIPSRARWFVFYDANVFGLHARRVQSQLRGPRECFSEMVVPVGEAAKARRVLDSIHDFLLDERISRDDLVVACGGGVTSDLIGYAAATVLRGVRWGVISTTLLGMVDAAIGGKTGINHPSGKNLLGAFWQPMFVICDGQFLQTLPARQMLAGMGEITKYAALIGGDMTKSLERYLSQPDRRSWPLLRPLILRSVAYKAGIVSEDERETGPRMVLNLGHTFAHALETTTKYARLLHGEAVTIGLLAAIDLSCRLKPRRARHLDAYRRCVVGIVRMLPRRKISADGALTAMRTDKKRAGDKLRFVLLDRPGRPFIATDVPFRLVAASLESALDVYRSVGGTYATHTGC